MWISGSGSGSHTFLLVGYSATEPDCCIYVLLSSRERVKERETKRKRERQKEKKGKKILLLLCIFSFMFVTYSTYIDIKTIVKRWKDVNTTIPRCFQIYFS